MKEPQILLTNDDGIQSPGLWAAAQALSELGFVHVVAPRDQYSGGGRSMPSTSDGIIQTKEVRVNDKTWTVYSVGGSPAQAVLHATLEILPGTPDLLVSGINYGENVGSGITISGTVGAALEGAAMGIPSLAVSVETATEQHYSYSEDVDFDTAAHFTTLFGRLALENRFPPDVDALKVDIPCDATPDTPWVLTRVSSQTYFKPFVPKRVSWDLPNRVAYRRVEPFELKAQDTDAYTLLVRRLVAVTPLSLNLTSRVDLKDLEWTLRRKMKD